MNQLEGEEDSLLFGAASFLDVLASRCVCQPR